MSRLTWTAATTLMMGTITPAVSQVGRRRREVFPSRHQRKQGVSPGRAGHRYAIEPTAAP